MSFLHRNVRFVLFAKTSKKSIYCIEAARESRELKVAWIYIIIPFARKLRHWYDFFRRAPSPSASHRLKICIYLVSRNSTNYNLSLTMHTWYGSSVLLWLSSLFMSIVYINTRDSKSTIQIWRAKSIANSKTISILRHQGHLVFCFWFFRVTYLICRLRTTVRTAVRNVKLTFIGR